jgi:hypothetical protein
MWAGSYRVALAAFVVVFSGPVFAQAGPAITVGGYYQQTTTLTSQDPPKVGPCNNTHFCDFIFRPVPAGKQLIATHLSCDLETEDNDIFAAYLFVQLPDGSTPLRYQFFAPTKVRSETNDFNPHFVINSETLQLYKASERPLVIVWPTVPGEDFATITGFCTIAGQLINAP